MGAPSPPPSPPSARARRRGAAVDPAIAGAPAIAGDGDAHVAPDDADDSDIDDGSADDIERRSVVVAADDHGERLDKLLVRLAGEVGLDAEQARAVLASGEYTDATREREQHFLDAGIHSVPAIILNHRHLIAGGQPVEVFEQALRQVANGELE